MNKGMETLLAEFWRLIQAFSTGECIGLITVPILRTGEMGAQFIALTGLEDIVPEIIEGAGIGLIEAAKRAAAKRGTPLMPDGGPGPGEKGN